MIDIAKAHGGGGMSEPVAYFCPHGCGCLWRDNRDGSMSLYGRNSKSCEKCERLPLNSLLPLYSFDTIAALLDERERLNSPVVLSEWQKLVAERDALARDAAKPERWKHVKTGGIYEIVTHATDENTVRPVVVYRDPGGGDVWVRPEEQFYDGRFVKVDPASGASDDFGPTIPMVKPGEKHGR